ncbi:poly(R)-hydroxyalkanoic acid synthase subunit PhaE [Accumulibacter sp.]|uniref:poly(R)-hydroxyalkanoic acid synthase subunit PhaE n=1 Tax=Accumulibacter sp. TaxID=2053492 RepID=UPI0025D4AFF8|nr:poly(R)-hydroxyalkanoic acid synthase subunit PhaE [Accumulibacter sp.]MCM8594906.1 hypothetical protein [Accumulibacter sp.]MCM8627849.1 hypothetical protein [Accumulibacter sp.]MDS4049052.1 poly(R)-hydroxyalkanoic acid synthase subunit PhaE [Accumulibacter sp.]
MENNNPNEQMGGVVNAWAETQKRMWNDWATMLQNLQGGAENPAEAARKGMEAVTRGTNEAARMLMDRINGSQGAMNRVMDFFFRSMKVVAPNLEANKDWRPDLKAFADNWAKESTAMLQRSLGLPTHLNELGSSLKEWPDALGPWLSFLTQAVSAGHFGETMLNGTSGLSRLLAMESDASAFSGVGEIPHFGILREKNAKLMRMLDAAVDMRKNSLKFHTAFGEALAKAVEATVEELAKLAAKGEKITAVRDLMRLWYRTADASLQVTFNSQEFLDAQNEFTKAQQAYKLTQRVVIEDVLRGLDIPTRSEIDEAYKVIHDLKKEVRALRKQLPAPAAVAAAKPAAVRKTPARAKTE